MRVSSHLKPAFNEVIVGSALVELLSNLKEGSVLSGLLQVGTDAAVKSIRSHCKAGALARSHIRKAYEGVSI